MENTVAGVLSTRAKTSADMQTAKVAANTAVASVSSGCRSRYIM